MSESFVLGLEERLAADAAGTERDRVLAELQAMAARARSSLDKGVAPADAQRLMALLAAVNAAQAVVVRVWAHLHRPRR